MTGSLHHLLATAIGNKNETITLTFFLINKSRKNILAIASLSTLTVSILTIMKKLNFIKKLIGPRILLIAIFGLLLLG